MHVVCAGDCGIDRYRALDHSRAGGITLNFAAHARRLFDPGDRVSIISALGTDANVSIVSRTLEELGVETLIRTIPGTTSTQLIDLAPDGEKLFVGYDQGVLGVHRIGDPERALIAGADLLVAAHYRQIDGFFESVMSADSSGLRAVDFADIAESPTAANVERFIDRFDIAFAGLSPSHSALIDNLEALARRSEKSIIVTLGASGSLALGPRPRLHCAAAPVSRVVDTTGAGDTFAAGFLREFCRGRNLKASLSAGAREAAVTVSRLGAF